MKALTVKMMSHASAGPVDGLFFRDSQKIMKSKSKQSRFVSVKSFDSMASAVSGDQLLYCNDYAILDGGVLCAD